MRVQFIEEAGGVANGVVIPEHRGKVINPKTGEILRDATAEEIQCANTSTDGRGHLATQLNAEWEVEYVTRTVDVIVAGKRY